jgi:hypothetical protein
LFAINVLVGLVALFGVGSVPITAGGEHRFDLVGAVLNATAYHRVKYREDGFKGGGLQ